MITVDPSEHNDLVAMSRKMLTALIDAEAMLTVYVTGKTNNATRGQAVSTIRDVMRAVEQARAMGISTS